MSMFEKGYQIPKSPSNYFKPQDGDNLVRILSKPLMGWLDWQNKKPIRTPFSEKPEPVDSTKPVKHFWDFVIWDYKDNSLKIWEVTQSTIQDVIYNLDSDPDWGEPTKYDLSIKKAGKDLETKYLVIAKPPKPLATEIQTAYNEANINLEELFNNGDLFNSKSVNADNIPF